jgi:hypothetical protein
MSKKIILLVAAVVLLIVLFAVWSAYRVTPQGNVNTNNGKAVNPGNSTSAIQQDLQADYSASDPGYTQMDSDINKL